jgi:acid phosphatase (class A)
LFLSLSLLLGACAGDQARKPRQERRPLRYLQPAQLDIKDFQPAPAPGSAADKADLAVLYDWQGRRTAEQCKRAKTQKYAYFADFYGDITPFAAPQPAEVTAFFLQVRNDADAAVDRIKDRFRRNRPFRRDKGLRPCAGRAGGKSYPSGHATLSRIYALILSDLVPERRAEFLARADEAALNRVIGGVHHPSDIEAGKTAGEIIYSRMRENPSFLADMEALRKYLKK